jgi:hypothetical protein
VLFTRATKISKRTERRVHVSLPTRQGFFEFSKQNKFQ